MSPATPVPVTRLHDGVAEEPVLDPVATEEPLEIRIEGRAIALVMRTTFLRRLRGFLLTDNVVKHGRALRDLRVSSVSRGPGEHWRMLLHGHRDFDSPPGSVTSSTLCVCGKRP